MKTKILVGLAGVLMFGIAAFAHHSLGATYEADKEIKMEGKIVQLLLRNPHSFLQKRDTIHVRHALVSKKQGHTVVPHLQLLQKGECSQGRIASYHTVFGTVV